jgi:Zn-dependent M28 family amino/carboxypeptidase
VVSNRGRRALGALAASLLGSVALAAPAQADPNNNSVEKLTQAVTLDGVTRHLRAFQRIADANGDNRASGLPGYDASADYVAGLLRRAGYDVTRQAFDFPYFAEFGSTFAQVAPAPTSYVDQVDYDLLTFSGSGTAEAAVVPIDVDLTAPRVSTSGCEAGDFLDGSGQSVVTGRIALLQRGTCPFGQKVTNAEAAGAVGAVIFNQGDGTPEANPDRYELFFGTLGGPVGIPAVSVSYFTGEQFANTAGLVLRITAETTSEIRSTENILAQSREGRTDNVVMAGAHLDSVPEGPGFNDNGSGSAVLLEVALRMAKVKTNNAVRFAWWGAEEAGLQGSNFYVANLPDEELADIALYLNFDMVGSPNYFFGHYDGDDSSGTATVQIPPGSAEIEDVFEKFYADRGLPAEDTDFNGRSDYQAFILSGIPAGGLFTGAEERKTAAQVQLYGGVAGAAFDPCYHARCDSLTPVADGADAALYAQLDEVYRMLGNVNTFALDVNADAVAAAVITFAFDTSTVNDVARAPGRSHGAGRSEDASGHKLI